MSADQIEFSSVSGAFTNAFVGNVVVTDVRGGQNGFSALVYQCKMNVDWDGSPWAYAKNNPRDAGPASRLVWDLATQSYKSKVLREDHFQRHLTPIKSGKGWGDLRNATSNLNKPPLKTNGLNFDHNFMWVGVAHTTPGDAAAKNLWIDDRDFLRDKNNKFPVISARGSEQRLLCFHLRNARHFGRLRISAIDTLECLGDPILRVAVRTRPWGQ